jgi:EmrB/QacA subfamily drug resistance transporter
MTSLDSRKRWFALAVIVAAQFMVVLDVAIVNVALPSIKTDLHFSQESLQWVITAYAILFGGVLLLGGRLADLLGRRRLFVAGLVLFTVSSLLDGLAWSEASLIGFRALQGLGAAMLSPAALSILTTMFKEGRERNIALGIWGAASGSGGAAGVLLGGALTSAFNWSWIFFINVPAGIVVLALVPFLLRESRADLAHRHFDTAGAASITGGLMLLVYAMTRASQHGWITAETIGLLAASAALVVAFVVIELRSKAPLLPMRIFRLRTLTASNISGLLLAAAVFSQFFLLTLYMQQVLHYSALRTGVAYVALTVSIIAFSGIAQALATRIGIRPVLTAGLLLSAGGLVLYAQLPVHGQYFWDLFPAFLLSGIGLALAFVPMSIGALTSVTQADAGVASGLINTSQQIGGAIGVGAAPTHGFQITFYVLAAVAAAGAVLAATLTESRAVTVVAEPVDAKLVLEAA